jgi:hypothetical protein
VVEESGKTFKIENGINAFPRRGGAAFIFLFSICDID